MFHALVLFDKTRPGFVKSGGMFSPTFLLEKRKVGKRKPKCIHSRKCKEYKGVLSVFHRFPWKRIHRGKPGLFTAKMGECGKQRGLYGVDFPPSLPLPKRGILSFRNPSVSHSLDSSLYTGEPLWATTRLRKPSRADRRRERSEQVPLGEIGPYNITAGWRRL